MKISDVSRCAMSLCAAAAVLAGCSSAQQGTQTLPASSTANKTAAGRAHSNLLHPALASESIVYRFAGRPADGESPVAALVNVNGTLYGTTLLGGDTSDDGTVFSVTTSGVESFVYIFQGSPNGDGSAPTAGLDKSARFGTTSQGGAHGYGTVFKITTSGKEKVLYSFGAGTDGQNPNAGLVNVSGTYYGTTNQGGTSGQGTVFSITPSGTENVLYSFAGPPNDGADPESGLINVNGVLYGTTNQGGTSGQGTMFSITTSGTENVLHSFAGGVADGANPPYGSLVNVNDGTLYGTTTNGGANGDGTVFKVKPSGTYKVLYSFGGSPDGQYPFSGLLNVNGTLYGTTYSGGTSNDGTVFSITKSGTENVLYSFAGNPDGAFPWSSLISVSGVLYGTTAQGGNIRNDGTVFSIVP